MMGMKAEQVILSRGLPKTGQTEIYDSRDDGFYQAGWWQGIKEPRTRFVAKTIGDNGDDVVIDLATGLMWAADGDAGGCNGGSKLSWLAAVVYTPDPVFAGFNDWRLPNIKELLSIINWALSYPAVKEPPFSNTSSLRYWSSTTIKDATGYAYNVNFDAGMTVATSKSVTYNLRMVRGGV